MSVSTMASEVHTGLHLQAIRGIESAKYQLDRALVRFDGWFLVFVAVILALGATIIAGLAIWCVVNQKGTFTGNWSFRDFGLKVYFECR